MNGYDRDLIISMRETLKKMNKSVDLNSLLIMYEYDLISKQDLENSKIYIDLEEELLKRK